MPTDYGTDLGKVRLNIGDDVEPYELADEIITIKLTEYNSYDSAWAIWYASLDCLQILISRASLNSSRLREREGSVEIEEYRNEVYKALKQRYDWLSANPPSSGVGGNEASPIIVGGTSKKETQRITSNYDNKRPPIGIGWFDSDDF